MQTATKTSLKTVFIGWRVLLLERPFVSLGLALSLMSVLLMVLLSLMQLFTDIEPQYLRWALLAGMLGAASTALGALPGIIVKKTPDIVEDSMLGVAAGMMLAATVFSLILPGLEVAEVLTANTLLGVLLIILGMSFGVLLMLGLDHFLPHEHQHTGPCGAGHQQVGRVSLFVLAIALHNFPEGMAIGVGFTDGDLSVGIPMTAAIALQNIPEGLAVVLALRRINMPAAKAVAIAAATGLVEPLGALFGILMASGAPVSYPLGLGIAAGAMLFVVSHEVIPETHRNGHQTPATLGLMAGFFLIMLLDTLLG
ncbi:GufA protein [Methylophaga lonarensis MPL]|uniref:GufA protein n=1 Tax=Methylophaga lonarensis MPL TaxID=1286106 RepID=M7NW13_9GAMM|nr:ZIP family metal transporter [Methylophaga lonarensis]EMR12963.1 GufA protein [Methylophaga lonarensis MPL]